MRGLWNIKSLLTQDEQMMSSGALIIAFDSETDQGKKVQYVRLAEIAKNLIKKHLNLPCAVVSDKPVSSFDESIVVDRNNAESRHVLIGDKHEHYTWYNKHRVRADQLTPWKRTLLIDADFLVQTDNLLNIANSDSEFSIVKNVYDPTGRKSFNQYRFMPNRTIPQLWATAMCWDSRAEYIFEYAREIEQNYEYYSRVFGFSSKHYRNDMIFSIAAHMSDSRYFENPMWMISSDCKIEDANSDGIKISYDHKTNQRSVLRINQDLHVLSKSIATDDAVLDRLEHWSLQ